MTTRVAWFDARPHERRFLEGIDELDVAFFEESLTPETVENAIGFDAVSVFVSSQITGAVITELDCETIACRSSGYDHVDLQAATEAKITVCNVPAYGGTTVAEHTFALLLALSRKIYPGIRRVKNGSFDHDGLTGFDLRGKALGIIGTGAIGREVIRIADGFGMHILAVDPNPDRGLAEQYDLDYVNQDELFRTADIVSLHCPLREGTRHLLDAEAFAKMDDTIVLNTARGGIIDSAALLEALETGNVKAAGLDVLEEECYIEEDIEYLNEMDAACDINTVLNNHALMDRDDVLITPHNGFNGREALDEILEKTLANLRTQRYPVSPK